VEVHTLAQHTNDRRYNILNKVYLERVVESSVNMYYNNIATTFYKLNTNKVR